MHHSSRVTPRQAILAALPLVALLATSIALCPNSASAQALPNSKITVGVVFERVNFSGGILESDLAGADSSRVLSATSLSLPLQFSTVIRSAWIFDLGAGASNGKRQAAGANTPSDDLSGVGDVRVRLSRRFDRLGLRLTVGGNLPTGVTGLDKSQLLALSVLASPAINLTQPAVGFGAGATVGLVKSFSSSSRQWGVAVGTSFEWRGEYDPFAALAVGASASAYDPGEVIRVSAGASRLFGESKGLVTASLDLFGTDLVSQGANIKPVEVQIGPTVAIDGQWQPATTRFKNAALFGAARLRSALKRDGTTLPNSGNTTLEAGLRGAKAMTGHTDVVFELSGRLVTAVEIDNRLATAASTSVAPVLGLAINSSMWTLQPALTARIGTVDTGIGSGGFTVMGARLTLERRF